MSHPGFGPSAREAEQRMYDIGAKWSGSYWFVEGNANVAPTLLPGTRAPAAQRAAAVAVRPAQPHNLTEARRQGAKYGREYGGDAERCAGAWGWRVHSEPAATLAARRGQSGVMGYIAPLERAIHVSTELPPAERNATVAHELGHAVLHSYKPSAEYRRVSHDAKEVEAEAFALAFIACRPKAAAR